MALHVLQRGQPVSQAMLHLQSVHRHSHWNIAILILPVAEPCYKGSDKEVLGSSLLHAFCKAALTPPYNLPCLNVNPVQSVCFITIDAKHGLKFL